MYVDDMVSSEACLRGNEERLFVATKSAVSDHIRMLGRSQDNPVPIMSTAKFTNGMVAQEVLGFVIDTQSMRISVPVQKIDDIRAMMKGWPLNRTYESIKEVASCRGKLRHFTTLSGLGGTWFGGCNSKLVWLGITILAKPQR